MSPTLAALRDLALAIVFAVVTIWSWDTALLFLARMK